MGPLRAKKGPKGLNSGFFTKELDPPPNLMDQGGFSLDLNWTHKNLPQKIHWNSQMGPLRAKKGSKRAGEYKKGGKNLDFSGWYLPKTEFLRTPWDTV